MAAIIRTSNELKFELAFADGDTRAFTLKNPKSTDLQEQIAEINSLILENNLLIGDKASGEFTGIYRVTRIKKRQLELDLSTGV